MYKRQVLLEVLKEDGQNVKGIYERNDIKVRAKEGLPLEKGYWRQAQLPTKTVINENGLLLNVDVENGQKTGYFLDQKSNRVLLRKMAHGKRVMDCFTHTGGFALNAAYGQALEVVAVDVSQTALDLSLIHIYFSPQKMRQVSLTDWRRASWDLTRCLSVFVDTKRNRGTAEVCASCL